MNKILLFLIIISNLKLYSQDKFYTFQGQKYIVEYKQTKDRNPVPIKHKDGNYAFIFDSYQYLNLASYKDNSLIDTVYSIFKDTIAIKSVFHEYVYTYTAYHDKGKLYQELFFNPKSNLIHTLNYYKNRKLAEEAFFVPACDSIPMYSPSTFDDRMIKRIVYLYEDKKLKFKICVYGLHLLDTADLYVKYSASDKLIGIIDSKEFYYLQNQKYKTE
jgi:hypothetical protein